MEDPQEILEGALDFLEAGEPEEALARLALLPEEDGVRWSTAALAAIELGELEQAEAAVERARERLAADDPELAWAEGRVHLASWRLAEARAAFLRIAPEDGGAPRLANLALLADLDGDTDEADRLLAQASRLDPQGHPPTPRLSPEEFEALVAEAAEALPDEFRHALKIAAVVIDPMPTAEIVQAPASGHPPDLLGLYVGMPLSGHEGHEGAAELPPTIFLFQRNIERACVDEDELREEIVVTLYHELGHALGFDEDGVDAMGLG